MPSSRPKGQSVQNRLNKSLYVHKYHTQHSAFIHFSRIYVFYVFKLKSRNASDALQMAMYTKVKVRFNYIATHLRIPQYHVLRV